MRLLKEINAASLSPTARWMLEGECNRRFTSAMLPSAPDTPPARIAECPANAPFCLGERRRPCPQRLLWNGRVQTPRKRMKRVKSKCKWSHSIRFSNFDIHSSHGVGDDRFVEYHASTNPGFSPSLFLKSSGMSPQCSTSKSTNCRPLRRPMRGNPCSKAMSVAAF